MTQAYLTQEATGFNEFSQVTAVRDHIIEHAENHEAAIVSVGQYIHKQWLTAISHPRNSLINRLMQQGYPPEELALALGKAWVNGSDHFSLPKRDRIVRWGKSRIALVISISTSLTLLISFTLYLFFKDHERFSYFVWIIGLPAAVLSWLLYELILFFWGKD